MPLDPEDELLEQNLRYQLDMIASPGWQIRKEKITAMFTRDMANVGLGKIDDPRENDRTVGRCRALNEILDMDKQIIRAWEGLQASKDQESEEGELEGGDHGVSYEAAQ